MCVCLHYYVSLVEALLQVLWKKYCTRDGNEMFIGWLDVNQTSLCNQL